MTSAEILTIGTEILLGEIVDTNARHIARALRDAGVDLYYTATVGDNVERIAEAMRQAMSRAEILITTGGLGPTVDDPTRAAVALAFGVELEFRPELWQQVEARFARFGRTPTENNKRQAYVPAGAVAIENPVGTAPAFRMETERNAVICLPGVPREMEHLLEHDALPYLRQRYGLTGTILARVLHTAGEGESAIDERIADLEELRNPTVGLAAHAGQVDVRITAKAESVAAARALIAPVEAELRTRLGERIYGADGERLEDAATAHLDRLGWRLALVEAGLDGALGARLAGPGRVAWDAAKGSPPLEELKARVTGLRENSGAEAGLGVALERGPEMQTFHLVIQSPLKENAITRTYGGPPTLAAAWAVNSALDILRRLKAE